LIYLGEAGFSEGKHAELIDCVRALAFAVEQLEGQ
jgi:hypothetical protein